MGARTSPSSHLPIQNVREIRGPCNSCGSPRPHHIHLLFILRVLLVLRYGGPMMRGSAFVIIIMRTPHHLLLSTTQIAYRAVHVGGGAVGPCPRGHKAESAAVGVQSSAPQQKFRSVPFFSLFFPTTTTFHLSSPLLTVFTYIISYVFHVEGSLIYRMYIPYRTTTYDDMMMIF